MGTDAIDDAASGLVYERQKPNGARTEPRFSTIRARPPDSAVNSCSDRLAAYLSREHVASSRRPGVLRLMQAEGTANASDGKPGSPLTDRILAEVAADSAPHVQGSEHHPPDRPSEEAAARTQCPDRAAAACESQESPQLTVTNGAATHPVARRPLFRNVVTTDGRPRCHDRAPRPQDSL